MDLPFALKGAQAFLSRVELATGRRRAGAALWRAAKAEKSPEPTGRNACSNRPSRLF
jgi:hypothetical protein